MEHKEHNKYIKYSYEFILYYMDDIITFIDSKTKQKHSFFELDNGLLSFKVENHQTLSTISLFFPYISSNFMSSDSDAKLDSILRVKYKRFMAINDILK